MSKQTVEQLYRCDICDTGNLRADELKIGWVFTPATGRPLSERAATADEEQMAGYTKHLCVFCFAVFEEL